MRVYYNTCSSLIKLRGYAELSVQFTFPFPLYCYDVMILYFRIHVRKSFMVQCPIQAITQEQFADFTETRRRFYFPLIVGG